MHSIRVAALVAAMAFGASAAQAQTSCPLSNGSYGQCSALVGTSAATLTGTYTKRYQRITNNSISGTLNCTRDPVMTATSNPPTVNGIGTFSIRPGASEEFTVPGSGIVPYASTVCVGNVANIAVAVEVY